MKEYSKLLELARQTLELHFKGQKVRPTLEVINKYSDKLACFVTLKLNGELRGCIGSIYSTEELYKNVMRNTINAAFQDSRFLPLSEGELPKISIEISVLTTPKPLVFRDSEDLLKKLKDRPGVLIKKARYSATFLPQVWEQIPDIKSFLSRLCVKAGLNPQAWKEKELEVYTYRVLAVEEKAQDELATWDSKQVPG